MVLKVSASVWRAGTWRKRVFAVVAICGLHV
jgi:hypothetical protein